MLICTLCGNLKGLFSLQELLSVCGVILQLLSAQMHVHRHIMFSVGLIAKHQIKCKGCQSVMGFDLLGKQL